MSQLVDLELAGCLRRLLKSRFIIKAKSENWYRIIVDKQQSLEGFMTAMAAKLIINEQLGVIYLQELDPEIEEKLAYQLGSKMILRKFATHALLIMRKKRSDYFLNPDASGKCFITKQELKELLLPFLEGIEKYKEDKKLESDIREALKDLRDLQVIFEIGDGSDVYEISPVCDVLLPLEDIEIVERNIVNYMKNAAGDSL
ncbi:MAG: DUF4194 domain-containing protein [Bacteriovoracaceae bacterium]